MPRDDLDVEDYQRASARMRELVATGPGFISYNTYRADDGDTPTPAKNTITSLIAFCSSHQHRCV